MWYIVLTELRIVKKDYIWFKTHGFNSYSAYIEPHAALIHEHSRTVDIRYLDGKGMPNDLYNMPLGNKWRWNSYV